MADQSHVTRALTDAGARTAPPAAVWLAHAVGGLTINDWMGLATIVYVVLQAAYLLWKWRREWRLSQRARG